MGRKALQPRPPTPAAPSGDNRRAWQMLILAAVVPLAVAILLDRLNIPLGCPGRFVYLYSPVVGWRLAALPSALLLAGMLGLGVWLSAAEAGLRRRAGLLIVALGAIAMGIWSYVAPPDHYNQHFFNAHSPSQDGAFVAEALGVDSVRDYLHSFPERAQTPPQEMRGTRVISNPPGTTLLAVLAKRLVQAIPTLGELAALPPVETLPSTPEFTWFLRSGSVGLVFFWLLTGLWLGAGVVFYLLARLFWPPVVAAVYALCCVFSPMTLLFTPGKDPAQLLSVALPLGLWLLAMRRRQGWAAALAGAAFAAACVMSLVHIWLAAIVVVATWLSDRRAPREMRRTGWRRLAFAGSGAALTVAALYFLCDLNLVATIRAVAHAQAEVTRGANAMPLAWQLLGVPLFLLFAGVACWTALLWLAWPPVENGAGAATGRLQDGDARFGRYLLLGSVVVMLVTAGFTNLETPRLWIPFVPLLLLGALLQIGVLRNPSRRVALLLALLVGAQIACATLQWALMDMREAETRLSKGLFFG